MATLHKDVKSAKLRKYFDDEFPKINTNTTIWNAFLKWSGHQQDGKPSADDAKKAALQVIAKGATQQVNSMLRVHLMDTGDCLAVVLQERVARSAGVGRPAH